MNRVAVAEMQDLAGHTPRHALVGDVDLVLVRDGDGVSVLYGRCLHRGALLADGRIEGPNLVCGLHGWDYRFDTGVSAYNNSERLQKFTSWVEDGTVWVDGDEIASWASANPQPYRRDEYQGAYQDPHGTPDEPFVGYIQELASHGLSRTGAHGPMAAMGVPRGDLPSWDDLQLLTAELHRLPLLDDHPVATELVIGPRAAKPLTLDIPVFVSDMSFGALSAEAKVALAQGARRAGSAICSGEGGMLPEEREAACSYLYELASARFGFSWDKLATVDAFHFKAGQGAKTGTGGHLPGHKVVGRIAEVRGLPEGQAAISPARDPQLSSIEDYRRFGDEVRDRTGGIPIGFKLSAQHIEPDIDAAMEAGADYLILDGRGGGTGAAPLLFRDNISVPTMPAIARARRHLDATGNTDVTLIATGGLRTAADFVKALALGADGIAVSNAAMQAIGCIAMRACHTDNCPVGIATQQEHLRRRLVVTVAAARLARFFEATVHLMQSLARACGHDHLKRFSAADLTTWKREIADLTGVAYAGDGVR